MDQLLQIKINNY